jgi:hypothetical protein
MITPQLKMADMIKGFHLNSKSDDKSVQHFEVASGRIVANVVR